MSDMVTRFSRRQRVEHLVMIVLFTMLCVTGLPQKYFQADVSVAIINALGGLGMVRWLHRVSGVLFALLTVVHVTLVSYETLTGKVKPTLVIDRQDFRDAITTLRYYLGLSNEQARFGRFDYKQKFEYWGLIMGGLVVVTTGLMLLYPIQTAQFLAAQLIPVAKAAHSNEGLLAFLTIVTWHIYNAHLSPDVFPFDASIFTGKISVRRMKHEHPLEYEEMFTTQVPRVPRVPEVPRVQVPRVPEVPKVQVPEVPGVPEVQVPEVPEVHRGPEVTRRSA